MKKLNIIWDGHVGIIDTYKIDKWSEDMKEKYVLIKYGTNERCFGIIKDKYSWQFHGYKDIISNFDKRNRYYLLDDDEVMGYLL